MRVADHALHAAQSPADEALQDGVPQGDLLRQPHVETDDFAHTIRADAVGRHHRHTAHRPLIPHMLVAGVQPQIHIDRVQPPLTEYAALRTQAVTMRLTSLLLIPLIPNCCTSASTLRVEKPCT